MNAFREFRRVAAAGAISVMFAFGPAEAAPIISAQIVANPTLLNVPFTLEDFGTGGVRNSQGRVTSVTGPLDLNDVVYSFTGDSGVYHRGVAGFARSPVRRADGAATNRRYLNARANSGGVTMTFETPQTAFNLLWGSLDFLTNGTSYNLLTFSFGGNAASETVSGLDVFNALSTPPNPVSGTTNVAVMITGLSMFDTVIATATREAFEFVPGTPVAVPAPASLALFGLGLVGLGLVRRRRQQA